LSPLCERPDDTRSLTLRHHQTAAGSVWGGRPRELAPWQTIAIGGLAGALASLATMPADVLKTRIMTAAAGTAAPNAGAFQPQFMTCNPRMLSWFCALALLATTQEDVLKTQHHDRRRWYRRAYVYFLGCISPT